jgi:hypothetical protein
MKKSLLAAVGLVALVALPAAPALADTPWIHIRVEEAKDQSKVSVNLPLSVVEVALEAAPELIEEHADIDLGDEKFKVETLRKIWQELSAAGDAELITVESEKENIRVLRRGDLVQVFVKDSQKDEEVTIEVPVSLVDAALSGQGSEINLKAAIAELQKQRGNIVTVREPDTTVRIWIDEQNAQD